MRNAVKFLLGLDSLPARDDAADALAIAVMVALSANGGFRA